MLDAIEFQEAKIPVISNVDTNPTTDSEIIKDRLERQMTGSVRWLETMLQFTQLGVEEIIEVGPGKVLCGLIKRTCKEIKLETVGTAEQLEAKEPALVS